MEEKKNTNSRRLHKNKDKQLSINKNALMKIPELRGWGQSKPSEQKNGENLRLMGKRSGFTLIALTLSQASRKSH